MTWTSITFSPLNKNYKEEFYNRVETWLNKQQTKFGLCYEEGESKTNKHLHIIVEKEPKNLRRAICTAMKYEPTEEEKKKVKRGRRFCLAYWDEKIHKDADYMFGYIQKENIKWTTSLNKSDEQRCWKYYKKLEKVKQENTSYECVSQNEIIGYAKVWLQSQKDKPFYTPLKAVLIMLHKEGKIPLSLVSKCRPIWEELWKCEIRNLNLKQVCDEIQPNYLFN